VAEKPETIHDFGGFPEELYRILYPAPGHPDLARVTAGLLDCPVSEDRGLDHGAWSVLRHLFPKADVPVYQVSLDATLPAEGHFQMGSQLSMLQKEGVLLLGSGNVVHNLRKLDWNGSTEPFDWALAFDEAFKNHLSSGRYQALIRYEGLPRHEDAVPTPDHYLPFLWMLGSAQDARPSYIYEGFQNGSLSMRCIRFDG
jgi:4,5-DOPA dioxygenase extradiol